MYTLKKGEVINFEGTEFRCLVNKLDIPKVCSKQYLISLSCEMKLEILRW